MSEQPKNWVIYNSHYGTFWGPNSGGYFGLWGAGLYTEAEAKRLARNKDRADHAHPLADHRDEILHMKGAFERLTAALSAETSLPLVRKEE